MNITPATPLQQQSPVSVTAPSLGQGADAIRSAPLPTTAHQLAIHPPTSAPLPSQPSQASSSPAENKTGLSGILPLDTSGPAAQKIEQTLSKMDIPPVEALILAALLLNLIFGRLNVLLVTLIGGWYALYRFRGGCTHSLHEYPAVPVRPGEGNEAVQWVNHALYALFPLISTDVLTPFIDLLEDALIQQVPPIVTSVRLTSAALGAQPMLLTGLRPMSDQEWFASLAPVSKHAEHRQTKSGHKVPLSGRHSGTKTHTRSASSGSRLSRSASASSVTSALNPDEIASEAQKRRKRDRILQKVSRRRAMHGSTPNSPATATSAATGRYVERGAGGPGEEAQVPDGDRVVGGNGEDAVEQDDPNAGQYVNYQVGFEYRRTESTEKKGWGLHVLVSHPLVLVIDLRYVEYGTLSIGLLWLGRERRRQVGNPGLHRCSRRQGDDQRPAPPLRHPALCSHGDILVPLSTRVRYLGEAAATGQLQRDGAARHEDVCPKIDC